MFNPVTRPGSQRIHSCCTCQPNSAWSDSMTARERLSGGAVYPKTPWFTLSCSASLIAGAERKSMSATQSGMMSLPRYFSHFSLELPRRSMISSKSKPFWVM